METQDDNNQPHELELDAGARAVINGALVLAKDRCSLEVGAGAFVLTGDPINNWSRALQHPHEELYFSLLEVSTSEDRFHQARYRLFDLLAQVVAQSRTYASQKLCAQCAAAMMSGDSKAALASASRLASELFEANPHEDSGRRPPLSPRSERRTTQRRQF